MKKTLNLKQLEEKLNVYYQNHPELEKPNFYCKDCGKFLIYDGANIHFNKRINKNNKNEIIHTGQTFLSTREYNGHIYHLCRCKECVGKKYDTVYTRKSIYSCKFGKDVKYAYDISDDDFQKYVHERQAITKDSMIKKYGEEKGLEKWNSYCQKQSITNTFEYKKEKYGMTEKEFKEYNKSRSSTKELFIKRHGEEAGTKMWEEYCERQRYTTSLEYFINEYGEEDGYKKYMSFDLQRVSFGGASKKASEFFEKLITRDLFKNHKIYFDSHPIEYCVNGYRLDFYDETINLAIEFYGDFWHMNPYIYKDDDSICVWGEKTIAKNKWVNDKKRIEFIQQQLDCRIIIVWEHELLLNKDKTIDRIIDIINNKNIKYIELNGEN